MKKEVKGALIGGIIGFVIPWIYLIFGITTGVPDIAFALQPILIISIITLILGLLLGAILSLKNKKIKFSTIIIFLIPWAYFLYKYLIYLTLPRIEQRGIGSLFINVLLVSLIVLLGGFVINKLKNEN